MSKHSEEPNTKANKEQDRLTAELRTAIENEEVEKDMESTPDNNCEDIEERPDSQSIDETTSTPENDTTPGSDHEDKVDPWISEKTFSNLFEKVGNAAENAYKIARRTTDTSYKVGKAIVNSQDQLKLMVAAGQSLKDLREVAGLTVSELTEAAQLRDKSLLEAVENGTATLSFELILRLSSLLARNDPIPFILKYSRTYSPETWKLLHDWGAGRLPLQYQREREFINIYRSKDAVRQLSDEGYAHVLEFTREAFNTALHFVEQQEETTRKAVAAQASDKSGAGDHSSRKQDKPKS